MLEIRALLEGRYPFCIDDDQHRMLAGEFSGADRDQDFGSLRDALAEKGLQVPTLYKHYAQAMQPGGVSFKAFNVDHAFEDCVDSFVLADLTMLKPKKRKRYLGEGRDHGGTET